MDNYSVTNIKHIRKMMMPYIITWIIYYAWVIVFTTWWTASPITDKFIGTESRVMLHSLNLISSAIAIFIIRKNKFRNSGLIGGIMILITSVFAALITNPLMHTICIILLAISLGTVNSSILIPFVYVLNNTEKFYSVVGSFLLISLLMLFEETNMLTIANGLPFSFIMLLISIIPIYFFRNHDLENAKPENMNLVPKAKKILYVTIILNCCYAIFCKGVGKAFLVHAIENSTINLYPIYYIGGLMGCILYFVIYKIFKNSNHITWNVTFSTFALAMFIYISATTEVMYIIFGLLVGIASTMGMINMYYIVGVIGKKYWNHFYVKMSVLLIGVAGGVSGTLLGNLVTTANDKIASIPVSIISVGIVIVLLMISPMLSNTYFKEGWANDSKKMEISNDELDKFRHYKLNKREIELCMKLIEGYTIRQAATMMNIQENTASSYCKKMYRKLNINSRIELINLFK